MMNCLHQGQQQQLKDVEATDAVDLQLACAAHEYELAASLVDVEQPPVGADAAVVVADDGAIGRFAVDAASAVGVGAGVEAGRLTTIADP